MNRGALGPPEQQGGGGQLAGLTGKDIVNGTLIAQNSAAIKSMLGYGPS